MQHHAKEVHTFHISLALSETYNSLPMYVVRIRRPTILLLLMFLMVLRIPHVLCWRYHGALEALQCALLRAQVEHSSSSRSSSSKKHAHTFHFHSHTYQQPRLRWQATTSSLFCYVVICSQLTTESNAALSEKQHTADLRVSGLSCSEMALGAPRCFFIILATCIPYF